MATLTATSRGQITLRRELLKHLGVRPGQEIEVDPMPNGEVRLRAAKQKHGIERIFGMLAHKIDRKLTLEDMDEAISKGRSRDHCESL